MSNILVFLVSLVVLGVVLLISIISYRNTKILHFRLALLNTLSNLNQYDIGKGLHPADWRYQEFDSVTYDEMLLKFWIPLKPERWYKDTSFLE